MGRRREVAEIEDAAVAVERLSFGLVIVLGVTCLYGMLVALEGRWEGVYKYCLVCVLAVLVGQCAAWVGHWVKARSLEKHTYSATTTTTTAATTTTTTSISTSSLFPADAEPAFAWLFGKGTALDSDPTVASAMRAFRTAGVPASAGSNAVSNNHSHHHPPSSAAAAAAALPSSPILSVHSPVKPAASQQQQQLPAHVTPLVSTTTTTSGVPSPPLLPTPEGSPAKPHASTATPPFSTRRSDSSSSSSDRPRGSSVPEDKVLADAAALAASGRYTDARKKLERHVKRRASDCSAKLWDRLLMAVSDEASTLHKGPEQQALLRLGLGYAKKVTEGHPASAVGWTWYAAFSGRLSSYKQLRDKIADSSRIRDTARHALKLDGRNALALHVMGVYCYNVARITWIERQAAAAFFGGSPPTSTFKDALGYLYQANALHPFFENSMCIGDCHKEMKNVAEARTWYKAALSQLNGPKNKDHFRLKVQKKMAAL